jgi:hypothetical protein
LFSRFLGIGIPPIDNDVRRIYKANVENETGLGGRSSPVPGLDDGELSVSSITPFLFSGRRITTEMYQASHKKVLFIKKLQALKSDFFYEFLCSDE